MKYWFWFILFCLFRPIDLGLCKLFGTKWGMAWYVRTITSIRERMDIHSLKWHQDRLRELEYRITVLSERLNIMGKAKRDIEEVVKDGFDATCMIGRLDAKVAILTVQLEESKAKTKDFCDSYHALLADYNSLTRDHVKLMNTNYISGSEGLPN